MGVSDKKVIYTKLVKGSVKTDDFIDYMREVIKRTSDESVYLLDNAAIHKTKKLQNLMAGCNRKLIYNVPYCPENNPIEMVFSKVKSIVRKRRSSEEDNKLKRNIIYGFKKIKEKDLKGYFKHALKR